MAETMGAPRKVDGWQGAEFLRSGYWHHAELTATRGLAGACSSGTLILNFDKLCPFSAEEGGGGPRKRKTRVTTTYASDVCWFENQVGYPMRLDGD